MTYKFSRYIACVISIILTSDLYATDYTFNGAGLWSDPSHWAGNILPPNPLPTTDNIYINGEVILDASFSMEGNSSLNVFGSGAYSLTINPGIQLLAQVFTADGVTITNYGLFKIQTEGIFFNGGAFYNIGTFDYSSDYQLYFDGTILNNSGIINVLDGNFDVFNCGASINSGTINITGNANFTAAEYCSGGSFENAGTINNTSNSVSGLSLGNTTNTATGNISIGSGSYLLLEPPFFFSGNLMNSGTISPYGYTNALNWAGNYPLNNGTLLIEIASVTAFDKLVITGTANLSGILKVELLNGYQPGIGSSYTILTFASSTGNFSALDLPDISPNSWAIQYNAGNVKLIVQTGLPINLLEFRGLRIRNGAATLLSFRTASESHNSHFLIEHSLDGKYFQEIGSMPGHGTTPEPHEYSFTHDNPMPGPNYYRLKQVDFDGAFTYSNIVRVNMETGVFSFSPNPTTGMIEISGEIPEDVRICVSDSRGSKVLETALSGHSLDLSALPKGAYILNLQSATQSVSKSLILQK